MQGVACGDRRICLRTPAAERSPTRQTRLIPTLSRDPYISASIAITAWLPKHNMLEKSDTGLFAAHQARQAALLSRLVLVIAVLILGILVTDADGLAHELSAWTIRNLVFGDFITFSLVLTLRPRASELATMAAASLLILGFRRLGLVVGPVAPIAVGSAWLIAVLPGARRGRDYNAARLWFVVLAALLLSAASTLALVGQQLTVWHVKTFDVPAYLTDVSYGFSALMDFPRARSWGASSGRIRPSISSSAPSMAGCRRRFRPAMD